MIRKTLWNIAYLALKTVGLLKWLMFKVDATITWARKMCEGNAYRAQILGGTIVIFIGIVLSYYPFPLPKLLAMVSTLLFAVWGTWILKGGVDKWRIIHAPNDKEKTIQGLEKKLEEQQNQIELQQQQLCQAQHRQLNLDSINRVLSLNLLEIKTHLKDFKTQVVETVECPGGMFTPHTTVTTEHLSFINKEVHMNYGINIEDIRVRDDGKRILVSGLKSKCTGIKSNKVVQEHSEIRKTTEDAKNKTVQSKVITQGDGHHKYAKEHERELDRKIYEGADIAGLEGVSTSVERIGMGFIEQFLSSMGKPIVFVSEDTDNTLPLIDFVEDYRVNGAVGTHCGRLPVN